MSHILPLSLDDLAPINDPYTPIGSPPTSNASSPRPPSPIGTLDSGYSEDDSYMPPQPPPQPPLSLDDLSSTPLSSNPSTEHSYNPLNPNDFTQLKVIRELTHWPCEYNNEDAFCDIPPNTILDIIDINKHTNMGPIFKCNFTYNGVQHYTEIPKGMLSGISPKIEYLTNIVGGYKRRSRKGRKSRSRKSRK